jgi:hypothetical protein
MMLKVVKKKESLTLDDTRLFLIQDWFMVFTV